MTFHVPVVGSWVRLESDASRIGRVVQQRPIPGGFEIEVEWGGDGRRWHAADQLRSGIRPGFVVQDVPVSNARSTLGPGIVKAVRTIADRDQALVQLSRTGRNLWLPAENLVRIKGPALSFINAETGPEDGAERWALSLMAHALKSWNEVTGALDRLDVDPLPHQIQLVHRILSSNNINWLIADDVGLGKTIEVGLLLAALERQGRARRVLVVCPAGLTVQWQDELRAKFDRAFSILGRDFSIHADWQWKHHDRVIVSLDYAKPRDAKDEGEDLTTRFGAIKASGDWDVIVFDEAHRLGRNDRGDMTLRFRLARELRGKTDALLLLTGTPHQGDTGRFRSLLQLVRPDLGEAIARVEFEPEVVRDIVLRNRKIDVTDADGAFIFRGHEIGRVVVTMTPEMKRLEDQLERYLARGERESKRRDDKLGRAIGFVMTTYRKLASSSLYALLTALEKRQARLAHLPSPSDAPLPSVPDEDDVGDDLAQAPLLDLAQPFFENEPELLSALVSLVRGLEAQDQKVRSFLYLIDKITRGLGKKVLVFTEYRATQELLARRLSERDPPRPSPALINGSMKLDDKRAAMRAFEGDADVLISTEAGGEGLNLHRRCHILVNYDLPWNPARLVQRIGRVYRYGQTEKVVIFNLQAQDTIDNQIIDLALQKVQTIATQMASLGDEFRDPDAVKAEILGDILERLDLEALLEEGRKAGVERTKERIDQAIERARRSREMQDDVLSHAGSFDLKAVERLGGFTTGHVRNFVERIAPLLEIEVEGDTRQAVFTLRLPVTLRGRFPEFGGRIVVPVTTDRRRAGDGSSAVLLDFASSFFRFLIERATAPEFSSGYAALAGEDLAATVVGAFLVRWQTDQGEVTNEELIVAARDPSGSWRLAPEILPRLFGEPRKPGPALAASGPERRDLVQAATDRIEVEAAGASDRFKHVNDVVLLAAADCAG